jgi:16S rRNA (adenine1518-N6/adenine1519-N6)-dimethyltransferase
VGEGHEHDERSRGLSASAVRALLTRHGLHASRERGQNFLVDEGRAARLVELAGVGSDDAVVEIGTGLGVLTRALAARARRVVTIEIDAGLVRALRAEALLPQGVELLHADALAVDWNAVLSGAGVRVRVVANLPYAAASPMLRALLDLRDRLQGYAVMVQREVAARLLARPGERAYGSFAVLHQLAVTPRRLLDLRPGCFFPQPDVVSSFVRMHRRRDAPLRAGELASVERVVRAAFQQRRKTLANALAGGGFAAGAVAAALAAVGLDPRVRAERVAPERWLALARTLEPSDTPGRAPREMS